MNRPPLEVADIVRSVGQSFVERSRKWINGQHEKVLLAITRCRTARVRWTSRSVLRLRTYCHLVQLVPKPALPQVSGQLPPALAPDGTARLRLLAATTVPSRLGCLLQTAFRRARTCAALSRRIHPSRRHFQQQVGCSRRRKSRFSLARLRPRQQEEDHDSGGRRVLAPLPSPPVATRLRAHPQLRISC